MPCTTTRWKCSKALIEVFERGGGWWHTLCHLGWYQSYSPTPLAPPKGKRGIQIRDPSFPKDHVPPCPYCGAPREFECQVMPSILHVLRVDQYKYQNDKNDRNSANGANGANTGNTGNTAKMLQ